MNTTEQELAFEKELSRLRKLRDNAGKSIAVPEKDTSLRLPNQDAFRESAIGFVSYH